MYRLELTKKFKIDIKNAKKRGLNLQLLDEVVSQLVDNGSLKPKYKPHKLIGNYKGFWECHIETIKLIALTRTGSHSDLF
ncbi:type II toxin-antitoxin system YafQ family toxin [Sphingobacterium sp.]|uniref:type II toxin-antitoxin system YafQ family toxin n=1 Tax=Sphingobacterium sp. TaxID=341027 RepID=UPI0028AE5404|nr:type II toxin-antitoxin system YafQ family toxin [Sphingobacterium sp.]